MTLPRLALALACLWGCAPASDVSAPRAADLVSGLRGVNRALAITQLLTASGTFEKASSAESIALALTDKLNASVGGACGHATRTGPAIEVTLGEGCPLGPDLQATGRIAILVTKDAEIHLALDLALEVAGATLSGDLDVSTANLIDYAYQADLQLGAVHLTSPRLRAAGAGGAVTLDLDGTLAAPSGTFTLSGTGLLQSFRSCAPTKGEARLTAASTDERFTFDAQTPATGLVTVTRGDEAVKVALPTTCQTG